MRTHLFVYFLLLSIVSHAQEMISGKVVNREGSPIPAVAIGWQGYTMGDVTDLSGEFQLTAPQGADTLYLVFSHLSYIRKVVAITPFSPRYLEVILESRTEYLDEVQVTETETESIGSEIYLDPVQLKGLANPSQDFTAILKTLPGVVSNNELSSGYSVRGGNYDENLVLVNGIPLYRPYLITNGRQEGLSLIVPEFAGSVRFSTGGWSARYGDKLSSILEVNYKDIAENELYAEMGLLGGRLTSSIQKGSLTNFTAVRYKSTQYLIGASDRNGEYRPRYTDIQNLLKWKLKNGGTFQWMVNYSRNRFYVEPGNRVTNFGTFNTPLRLFVAFDGSETMNYDTWQSGIRYRQRPTEKWVMDYVFSAVRTIESEYTNVEGGYRLCDIDKNTSSNTFNDCVATRGVGTNFQYSRNDLNAMIYDVRLDNQIQFTTSENLSFGLQYNFSEVKDRLLEYSFLDSADYVIDLAYLEAENQVRNSRLGGYVEFNKRNIRTVSNGNDSLQQNTLMRQIFSLGLRGTYNQVNSQWFLAPRLRYSTDFWVGNKRLSLSFSTGLHYQPPFYRELRNLQGETNLNVKSQSSITSVLGLKGDFRIWDRPFNWTAETFYKYLSNVVPYQVDNIRIRYLPELPASGYAYGVESRVGGEFIPGTESWFSMSVLSTKEDIEGDSAGYIRRPSDQRVTVGVYFQDYFPNNPNMKVNVSMQFGSGLPFGPPGDLSRRSIFTGDSYKRVDLGFIRDIDLKEGKLMFAVEVLNVLGTDNPITYTWIRDVFNSQIAVPNSLTGRFFNVRVGYLFQ